MVSLIKRTYTYTNPFSRRWGKLLLFYIHIPYMYTYNSSSTQEQFAYYYFLLLLYFFFLFEEILCFFLFAWLRYMRYEDDGLGWVSLFSFGFWGQVILRDTPSYNTHKKKKVTKNNEGRKKNIYTKKIEIQNCFYWYYVRKIKV